MNREAIYSALFARVSGASGIVFSSRKMDVLNSVQAANTPALFMAQRSELAKNSALGAPPIWTLNIELFLYVDVGSGSDTVPASLLNPIIDAIESSLSTTNPSGRQTLGGLVQFARINGEVRIVENTLSTEAAAIIPVEIIVNS